MVGIKIHNSMMSATTANKATARVGRQNDFLLKLRAALEKELPRLSQYCAQEQFAWDSVKALAHLGVWGMVFPKEYGGLGLSHSAYVQALEEFGRVDSSLALTAESHNSLCGNSIVMAGNEEQKRRYLPRMAKGEIMGAWALTEPEAGSDAKSLKTRAELKDGAWILNGSKTFTTQGSVGGVYVIFAQTTANTQDQGISAFVAEPGQGLEIGKVEKKMGLRASDTAQIHLVNFKIPKANLLGTLGRGFPLAMKILEAGRVAISGVSLGMARSAIEEALRYLSGKPKEIPGAQGPGVRASHKVLAQYTARLHAVRLLTLQAAELLDQNKPFAFYGSMAKLLSGELAMQASTEMMNLIGDKTVLMGDQTGKQFLDGKLYQIGEGTSEIQALLISRALFEKPELLLGT